MSRQSRFAALKRSTNYSLQTTNSLNMNPKIMANVGRRSGDYELLKKMALAGMETARLNFSHASNDQLIELKVNLEKIKQETGKDVKIM